MVCLKIHYVFLMLIQRAPVDFCIWGPPVPGQTVGQIEGEMVAWCTQPGWGTRVIPDGTITGAQFTKSPGYVEIVGYMNQVNIDMVAGDEGGEMDPHGADGVSFFLPRQNFWTVG